MMKHYNQIIKNKYLALVLGGLFFMASSASLKAAMSGSYTIGSGGNYSTLAAFASALSSGGVNGAVKAKLISNVSSSSTTTFNAISGTSATNTITIDGNGFSYSYSGSTDAILFNGADYVTFDGVKLLHTSTSTGTNIVRFTNVSEYNRIINCVLEYTRRSSASSNGTYVAFAPSTTGYTSSTYSWTGRYNRIENNTMKSSGSYGPGRAFSITNNRSYYSSSTNGKNVIKNNKIEKWYQYGAYVYYAAGDSIINNDFSGQSTRTTRYGIYGYYSYYVSAHSNDFSNLNSNTFYGLMPYYYCYYWDLKSNKLDNINASGSFYGVYAYYYPRYLTMTDNSFSNNSASSTFYGLYNYYYLQYANISNNHWDNNKAGSTFYGLYAYYYAMNSKVEKNSWSGNYNSSTFYGIYMYYYARNTSTSSNTIANNSSSSTFYGIYRGYYHDNYKSDNNVVVYNESRGSSLYGIYHMYGYYQTSVSGNRVSGNTSSSACMGLYCYSYPSSSYTITVDDNVIDSNTAKNSYAVGMYIFYGNHKIRRNRVSYIRGGNSDAAGIFSYYAYGLENQSNLVHNVTSYRYDVYGMYLYSSYSTGNRWDIRQNTIYNKMDNYSSGGYANWPIYNTYSYSNNQYWVGNLLYAEGGDQIEFHVHANNNGQVKEYSNNSYWYKPDANTTSYGWRNTQGTYTSWATYEASGHEKNAQFVDPKFADPAAGDFSSGQFKNQNGVVSVNWNTKDVLNETRNPIKSDHGAIEGYMDIAMDDISFFPSLGDTVCSGSEFEVIIRMKNNFSDTAYDIPVVFNVNGKETIAEANVYIPANDTASALLGVKLKLNEWGNNDILVHLLGDDNSANDSFSQSVFVKPAPGGSEIASVAAGTQAKYQKGRPFDVTIINNPIIFDLTAPRGMSNATYGTDWTASSYAQDDMGNDLTGTTSLMAPSGTDDLQLSFVTSDAGLEESTITWFVKISDLNNGCDTVIKRDVLIYPSITPDFVFPAKICDGEAVLFENKSSVKSGGMEFFWNFGTGTAADTSNAPEPVFQFPASGTYDVILTAKTLPYGFVFHDTQSVEVNAIPTVAFDKKNACEGENLEFTNKTTPTTATWSWAFGDGATSTANNPTHKYAKAGTYSVTLTADLNGCVASLTQRVYQFDRPKADWALVDGICDNDAFSFTNKSSINSGLVGSYWDFDDNGSVSTELDAEHQFSSAGKKMVKLVATSEFGCSDSMVKEIEVRESPKVSFTNTAACSLTPTEFTNTTADIAGTVANYAWDFGDGTTSTAKSPTKNWSSLGPKMVTLTVTLDNGCSQTMVKDMSVLTQPKANFTAGDVCAGEAVVFVNNTTWPQGEISYNWDFGDNTTASASDPSKTYTVIQTTSYNVTLYAYIKGGCADSLTQRVTINEAPRTCDFSASTDYEFGFFGVTVEPVDGSGNTGGQDNVDYTWIFEGGGKLYSADKDAAVQHNFVDDGAYTITMRAKVRQTGCECTKSKEFVMNRSAVDGLAKVGMGVFPNPSNGQFQVALTPTFGTDVSLELTTLSGQRVWNSTAVNNGLVDVQVNGLTPGVYLIRVSSETQSATQKITIQN